MARGIYATAAGRRVVVLHVFAKKSRKTPRWAPATARERMRQVTLRIRSIHACVWGERDGHSRKSRSM